MKYRVIKKEQQLESNWSGGKTYELAIFPEGAKYLDRDFLWRLSTANSDREESSFTKLPDYDRILMVLEGDVVLAHGEQRSAHLQPLEQDQFDGAVKTKCFGKLIRDYNLIYVKGARARMELKELRSKASPIEMSADALDAVVSYGVFCLDGYAVVSCGETSEMIRPEEQCVIDFPEGVTDDILIMGEGRCIITEIIMGPAAREAQEGAASADDTAPDSTGPTSGAAAGAGSTDGAASSGGAGSDGDAAGQAKSGCGTEGTAEDTSAFADFKACLWLYFSRNRWSMVMRKEGRSKVYYDRELTEALRKVERRYITLILWLAEIMICCVPVFRWVGLYQGVGALILFTLLHIFVIAPCVYMIFLPRPLCRHMKSIDQLNAAEQAYHKQEISEDPHFDRLMRKYQSDDENYFTDEESPLYRFMKRK